MIRLPTPEVAAKRVLAGLTKELGLVRGDAEPAIVAGALRRAACLRCPCSRRELIDAVVTGFSRLPGTSLADRSFVAQAYEKLLGTGDLLEAGLSDGRPIVQLAPPRFVRRPNGTAFLLGGLPDVGLPLIGSEVEVSSRGAYRWLSAPATVDIAQLLTDSGFAEMPPDAWLQAPNDMRPDELLRRLDRKMDSMPPAGEIDGLEVLDPSSNPRYYRGRWVAPATRSGRFVARAPARYAGRLWLYVELDHGRPDKMVRLPQIDARFRGADEALWVQAAHDAINGVPQAIERSFSGEQVMVSVFSPLPTWAERHLQLAGEQAGRRTGALLTYALGRDHADDAIAFVSQRLWLAVSDTEMP